MQCGGWGGEACRLPPTPHPAQKPRVPPCLCDWPLAIGRKAGPARVLWLLPQGSPVGGCWDPKPIITSGWRSPRNPAPAKWRLEDSLAL